ncbi:MAG: hypothetical protein ABR572_11625 [Cryomorphaceae bacterium]|nr:hypothetical protein [Flavobacteriales bacterium]
MKQVLGKLVHRVPRQFQHCAMMEARFIMGLCPDLHHPNALLPAKSGGLMAVNFISHSVNYALMHRPNEGMEPIHVRDSNQEQFFLPKDGTIWRA